MSRKRPYRTRLWKRFDDLLGIIHWYTTPELVGHCSMLFSMAGDSDTQTKTWRYEGVCQNSEIRNKVSSQITSSAGLMQGYLLHTSRPSLPPVFDAFHYTVMERESVQYWRQWRPENAWITLNTYIFSSVHSCLKHALKDQAYRRQPLQALGK